MRLLSVLLIAAATPAFADDTPDDTIVVTANRTEQPLSRVGQSVTVFDSAEIQTCQTQTVADLLRTPRRQHRAQRRLGTNTHAAHPRRRDRPDRGGDRRRQAERSVARPAAAIISAICWSATRPGSRCCAGRSRSCGAARRSAASSTSSPRCRAAARGQLDIEAGRATPSARAPRLAARRGR